MHSFSLSLINDTVDQKAYKEIIDFHTKGLNRIERKFAPFNLSHTLLNQSQIETLQWPEHSFGNEEKLVQGTNHPDLWVRNASASNFSEQAPLDKSIFEQVLHSSFSARLRDGRIIMPYPSAGALYSGQVIVFVKNVEDLPAGSYHYLPMTNKLEKLNPLSTKHIENSLFINQEKNLLNYDFFIFYDTLASKHIAKYGYRGYRLSILEVGSMYRNMENISMLSGLKSRVWGGFKDEALAVALGVDPRVILPVICQLIGR